MNSRLKLFHAYLYRILVPGKRDKLVFGLVVAEPGDKGAVIELQRCGVLLLLLLVDAVVLLEKGDGVPVLDRNQSPYSSDAAEG
jgi:hypothetical protein